MGELERRRTRKECFDFYQVKPNNVRWSWSGRNEEERIVVVILWDDQFEDGYRYYRSQQNILSDFRRKRHGHVELLRNLEWSQDNYKGEVRVIIAYAKDPSVDPRSISHCVVRSNFRMRVAELNEQTGSFLLERV